MQSTLLQRRLQGSEARAFEKLEVFASFAGGQLSIIFRNNISGITQKLGEMVFRKDETLVLDIIGWTGTAVGKSYGLDREIQELTSKYDDQSKKMEKLNDQLDKLIKAKIEHEDCLLQKFRALLNTKKLKIRDQQRLLTSAKYEPKQAAKLHIARSTSKRRVATASRAGKRKAKSSSRASESSEESGFSEKAPKQKQDSDLSEQMSTTKHSDQHVTGDENGYSPDLISQAAKLSGGSRAADGANVALGEEMQLDIAPLTRDLPFEVARKEQAKRPIAEDRTTLIREAEHNEETDDDEL